MTAAAAALAVAMAGFSGFAARAQAAPVAPVPEAPVPAARPAVTPTVTSVPASGVSARSAATDLPAGTVQLAAASYTGSFQIMGASWQSRSAGVTVQGRTQSTAGTWSPWTTLDSHESGDADEGDRNGLVADPVWAGDSTALEVRAVGAPGTAVTGLAATAVSSPATADDANLGTVSARVSSVSGVPQPSVISRAGWGADESLLSTNGADCVPPSYDSTVKAAVIHHTEGTNDYTAAQSASIVRGIYAYHVNGNKWCDIGYNFLVDKYGQVFEGRHGGITLPVHGAHATLWNTDTVGISFMMSSMSMQPTQASLDAATDLIAWKLGSNYRDPRATTTLVGATQPVIFGHGDVMQTDCPGTYLHAQLPYLRAASYAAMRGNQLTPLYELWQSTGGDTGTLGAVYNLERNLGGGRVVDFAKGAGYMRPDRQVFWLGSGLAAKYAAAGGPMGPLGWPTSSQKVNQNGVFSATFSNGTTLTYETAPKPTGYADPTTYTPVAPARLMDTRLSGSMAPNSIVSMPVAGQGGVPAQGVVAAVLNVTVTDPKGSGYLSAYPTGVSRPEVSNINFVPGQTVPNLVTVKLGSNGQVTFLNANLATADVVVDVAGYFTDKGPQNGGGMIATQPTRVLDTRSGLGASGRVPAGGEIDLAVTRGVVPTDAKAALLNLTVADPTVAGYLTAYPAGAAAPVASNVNFVAGQTAANLAVVKIGSGGVVKIRNGAAVPVDVVADVNGYVSGSGTAGGFRPANSPVRMLDTRSGISWFGAVGANKSITLQVTGRAGVPTSGVSAVVLNLTATEAQAAGYITAYPTGSVAPGSSNLNLVKGRNVGNLVVVKVGANGTITLNNTSLGTTQLVADIQGYVV